MKVEIDGAEYIKKPEQCLPDVLLQKTITADNDVEAARLYYAYEPLCPECGKRAFPTNFPASSVGGDKSDKSVVWFCSDVGHCAFSISKDIKWQRKRDGNNRFQKAGDENP